MRDFARREQGGKPQLKYRRGLDISRHAESLTFVVCCPDGMFAKPPSLPSLRPPPCLVTPCPAPPPRAKWTLELIKSRIFTGTPLTWEVVDIGDNVVVKYGTALRVSPEEGQATRFVASSTCVRVPEIYAILHDDATGVTYLIQEKLPGTSLKDLLPRLDEAARATIAKELKAILGQLAALDGAGDMGLFGRPFTYGDLFFPNFDFHDPGGKIETTEAFVHWIPLRLESMFGLEQKQIDRHFDFSRRPIFSHGDFVPENILVVDGHVSGLIDWAAAGWYPYFWNYYVGNRRRRMPDFSDGKWEAMLGIMMDEYPDEFQAFRALAVDANSYL
ncbi:kinase-like domain-containing protein [Mycena vitilis]|nr:kinase-like domain-containing protein [Mycena vitilis]